MRSLEGFILPALISVLLHAALLVLVAGNWQPEREIQMKPVPRHVKAKLVTLDKPAAKPQQAKPRPPPQPQPKPEPPKPKAEPAKPPPKPQPKKGHRSRIPSCRSRRASAKSSARPRSAASSASGS